MTIENDKKYKLTGEQIKDLASRFGVLSGEIGDLSTLTTTDKTSAVAAINELGLALDGKQDVLTAGENITIVDESGSLVISAEGGSGPTVVQTTGTSTTDVMSQNAVTSMVFADPATQQKIKIGAGTSSSEGENGIEIGYYATANGQYSVAMGFEGSANATYAVGIGGRANAYGSSSTAVGYGATGYGGSSTALGSTATVNLGISAGSAIGFGATSSHNGSVALGAYSTTNAVGQVNIGSSQTHYGYNSSNYRLLTGLYDPQSAHDAATKGYVDPTTDSSAPTTATVGRLGQIQIDTTNADAYMCVAVDSVTPSYTWKKITV